MSYAATHVT